MNHATYNIVEASTLLDCTPTTLVERIEAGDMPGTKFGRSWVIPVDAFWQRLNELAIEESGKRRALRSPLIDLKKTEAQPEFISSWKSPRTLG